MARYEVKNPLTPEGRNQINSMFEELYKEYTGAGINAKDAREKAVQAVADSILAKDIAETTRQEMLAIIREQTKNGDLAPEIAQARGGKQTLGERFNSVDKQLAQKANESDVNDLASNKADTDFVVTELNVKRDKSVKIEPEDASERLLQLVTGQGTINLESIPQDESVTPTKLTGNTYDANANRTMFESKDQEVYKDTDFNILGDIKSGNPLPLFEASADVEYLDNYTSLFSKNEHPKVLRYHVKNTGSSPSTVRARIGVVVDNPVYYASAWYKLSDLLALNDVAPFRPYFILYDKSYNSLGGGDFDSLFTNEQLSTLGYTKEKTFSNVGRMTTTIKDIKGDWVFISTKYEILHDLGNVGTLAIFLPRFTVAPVGTDRYVDIINMSTTKKPFVSSNIPFSNALEKTVRTRIGITKKVSPLQGKKWVLDGDSNTEANNHASKKYYDFISEQTGVNIENHAVSGTGYMTRELNGTTYNPVYTRIPNYSTDADIITILAGGNNVTDMALGNIALGKLGDSEPEQSYYGALDYTFKTLLEKFPTTKIGAISQFKRGNYPVEQTQAHENILQPMVQALKDVCGFYGIPVLDLYNGGNVHMRTEAFVSGASSDGIHLNNTGHEMIANKIKVFLESL